MWAPKLTSHTVQEERFSIFSVFLSPLVSITPLGESCFLGGKIYVGTMARGRFWLFASNPVLPPALPPTHILSAEQIVRD